MAQTDSKKTIKFYLVASLGLLIPIFIIVMAFFAVRSDIETQKKYDQFRKQQEEKFELQKQQNQGNQNTEQSKIQMTGY